jgi:hypothetical protein
MATRAERLGLDPRVQQLFEDLNRPSANKLFLAAVERGIPLTLPQARQLLVTDDVRQEFAPGPKFGGKIVSGALNERWAADLVDQKANRGSKGETAILVVQDIFSRRLFGKALMSKQASEVAGAFESILNEVGQPKDLTTDGGGEWGGEFARLLRDRGIPHLVKPVGDAYKNDMATLDSAIRGLREALGRVRAGAEWPSKLASVIKGLNETPNAGTLEQRPASVPGNEELQFALKQKAARDIKASAKNSAALMQALQQAQFARELRSTGPFPGRRAGVATWGPPHAITSAEAGSVSLANGARGGAKAFRPAPQEWVVAPGRTRLRKLAPATAAP